VSPYNWREREKSKSIHNRGGKRAGNCNLGGIRENQMEATSL